MTDTTATLRRDRIEHPTQIGDVAIHDLTFDECVDWIVDRAATGRGCYICTPNADYVVKARRDRDFREALSGACLRVPDGMWIVYASRIAGRGLHGTVTGRALLPAIAERARERSLPVALFGAAEGVAAAAAAALQSQYRGLHVVATVSPPMGLVIGSPSDRLVTHNLIAARPAIVFVGLGAPLGARWMHAHARELPSTVLLEIGAGLDIAAGRFRVAPHWMTRLGVEWLFRLAQEPRRLSRRYLVEDPWIILWAIRARVKGKPNSRR